MVGWKKPNVFDFFFLNNNNAKNDFTLSKPFVSTGLDFIQPPYFLFFVIYCLCNQKTMYHDELLSSPRRVWNEGLCDLGC